MSMAGTSRGSTRWILVCVIAAFTWLARAQAPAGGHQHPPEAAAKPQPAAAETTTQQTPQPAGPKLTLQDLERMALEKNPTITQAQAEVRAAEARVRQAGAYPNPVIGATADEVAGGPIIRYGEWGGFVEQRLVTGGKLGLSRRIAEQEAGIAKTAAEAQRRRVLNSVRSLFYEGLGQQELLQLRTNLADLARRAVQTSHELANVGQADKPDVLAAEVEAQRLDLSVINARNALDRIWRQIAAVVNELSLRPAILEGDLEAVPRLDFEQALAMLYKESPEIRSAELGIARWDLAVRRTRAERIPDIVARGGLRYNRELLEEGTAPGLRRPVGTEGFFDVGIAIPIFNRYRGAIEAASAEAERARLEVSRRQLDLRTRLASAYREYQDSFDAVERYRSGIIPKARESYDLYLKAFRQMTAAYPQVLIAQRNLFQLQEDYLASLVSAWRRAVEIQGLLLLPEEPRPGQELAPGMPWGAASREPE